MQKLTVTSAKAINGGLSCPGKMPCKGYSIPAKACNVGSILYKHANTVCRHCYARKGNYVFPNVQKALYKRLKAIDNPNWVLSMAFLINKQCAKTGYFRWHDSGDIQSLEHLKKIVKICELTNNISHWLPTKEYGVVKDYLDLIGKFPDNLTIRVSSPKIDGKPLQIRDLPTSGVVSDYDNVTCLAPLQDNKCLDCRKCWDKNISNVNYYRH